MKLTRFFVILLISSLLPVGSAKDACCQETVKVAVATNFIRTMKELAGHFEKETGIILKRSSSATGVLYAQIVNGAPYDLFLAADEERPKLLHRQGLCEEPFVYAGGRVVLWSSRKDLDESEDWQRVIAGNNISRIAMANPGTAPYGEATLEALAKVGIMEQVKKRLVYGQNVGQAFQYGQHGAADLAFVALSFALTEQGRNGKTWMVPEAPPVIQKGCLMKNSSNKDTVKKLIAYLRTDKAKAILSESGYQLME